MIEMVGRSAYTEVSRVFAAIYPYTARLEELRDRTMKRLDWKYLPIGALLILSTALAPVFRAQTGNTVTRVTTVPPDATYTIDGTSYSGPSSSVWSPGKHVLNAISPQYPNGNTRILYTFKSWDFGAGSITMNPLTVTTSSDIAGYVANFDVSYALSLIFFNCPDPATCNSPGTVYVNGSPYIASADVFVPAGSQAIVQAIPNPGWVFVGWTAGSNQQIVGFQNTVTMNAPVSVYPKFQPARSITLLTNPDGLQVLADRAPVFSPTTLQWGMNTTHSVGPVTPQQDKNGKYWSFKSWSDGGAATHAYDVGGLNTPDSLTATYVPAASVTITTQPLGLPIKVDGYVNAVVTPLNPYYFTWGVGETHHIEAPAQTTDSQGRVWKFSSWSNGGSATQDLVVPDDAPDTGGIRLIATYTQLGKLTVTSTSATSIKVDGNDCAVPCEVIRDIGTQVHISALASIPQGDGSRLDFNGWPGGGSDYTTTLTADNQTLAAVYHAMNRLLAASDPTNGAAIRVDPASGDGFYRTDAVVSLSLTAQPGFKFRRWDGDLSGTIPSGALAMTAPRAVKAVLDAVPYIAPAGVSNAAGSTPSQNVAPGSVISVFGANLATSTASAGDGMLPQTLAGVTARIGDRLLALVFASPTQINAVLPSDLAEGSQTLTISPPGQPDVRAAFTVARNAPGLFGTVFHSDGSAVSADSPAHSGELLNVYGTGFGPTDHPRLDGFPIPASPAYLILDGVEVRIGDTSTTPDQAFATPGRVGIDAVQFRIPDGTPSGPLKVVVNGVESNSITLAQ
jgi:uncharacterized protein (TIGR03437 family)